MRKSAESPCQPFPTGTVELPCLEDRFPGLEAAARAGFAQLDAGQSIPLEAVEAWIESWGSDQELPAPVAPGASR